MIVIENVPTTKEAGELKDGILKFLKTLDDAREDGWSFTEDIPTVLRSTMQDLLPAFEGANRESLIRERDAHPQAFLNTAALLGAGIIALFLPEDEVDD